MVDWFTRRLDKNVFRVDIPYTRKNSWEWRCLLYSDGHLDSIKSDRELYIKHQKIVKANKWSTLSNGDLYDVMQGKFDPRQHKGALRFEYQKQDYLDVVVDEVSNLVEPFACSHILMGDGNHETKIRERLETNLTQRTIAILNNRTGSNIQYGCYAGWVHFFFKDSGRKSNTICLRYHHGSGLKSEKKKISQAATFPDANILLYGHYHDMWQKYNLRLRSRNTGKVYEDMQVDLSCGGYKQDMPKAAEGWATQMGHLPKVRGAWWIVFYYCHKMQEVKFRCEAAL